MDQGPDKPQGQDAAAPPAERILVADDDAALGRLVTRMLAEAGYAVDTVLRGDAARDRLDSQQYTVVLSDVNMPGLRGPELLRACRQRWPDTEVILITGEPELAAAVQCVKEGAFDYLSKPVEAAVLLAKVASAVDSCLTKRRTAENTQLTPPLPPGLRSIRLIGSGAMGMVLQVEREGRQFALKVLRADVPDADRREAHKRFCREASILSGIDHPGVVRVVDWGTTPAGQPFILMEYIEGKTLEKLAAEQVLTRVQKLDLLWQIGYALQFVHRRGIIHRDIKPSNVLVTADLRAKLSDFGVARVAGLRSSLTIPGCVIGSPAYMAPETFSGAEPDQVSDVFSLGVVSYELLTGASPFQGDNLPQLVHSVTHDTPLDLRDLAPNLTTAVQDVIMRMIAKTPRDRCQSVDEFLAAVGQAIE
jgi:CheY-like chemotaxis protein/tRNA A-37 threonylcarbamoyl transferase component Bud32